MYIFTIQTKNREPVKAIIPSKWTDFGDLSLNGNFEDIICIELFLSHSALGITGKIIGDNRVSPQDVWFAFSNSDRHEIEVTQGKIKGFDTGVDLIGLPDPAAAAIFD
jgi:hypothetical protein